MSKKYYVVRKERKTEIFETWEIVKTISENYQDMDYKSFNSLSEAKLYLKKLNDFIKSSPNSDLEVFTDGSYDNIRKQAAFGLVFIVNNTKIKTISEMVYNQNYLKFHNVAGEVLGSIKAIKWAINNNYNSITVNYDYKGIEEWAEERWKANNELTQFYVSFIKQARENITIKFKWIKSHSGNKYNDLADSLAKKALNIH